MSSAPGTIIMIARPYSCSSIAPRNCAPFARNSSTVVSMSSHMSDIRCARVHLFGGGDAVDQILARESGSKCSERAIDSRKDFVLSEDFEQVIEARAGVAAG